MQVIIHYALLSMMGKLPKAITKEVNTFQPDPDFTSLNQTEAHNDIGSVLRKGVNHMQCNILN